MRSTNHGGGMRVVMGLPTGMEWLIILAVVILVFGAGKLSGVGGALGKSIREFREEKEKPIAKKETEDTKQLSSSNSQEDSLQKSEPVESGVDAKREG
jgi:sec-independent protein translocase protein TatA